MLGHNKTTCLSELIATKADLMATSVLPKPTSPHKTLFIGLTKAISFWIALIASNWSAVSLNGKSLLKIFKSSSLALKTNAVDSSLLDSISNISAAWSYALFWAFSLFFSHLLDDKESSFIVSVKSFLWYLLIKSTLLSGTYKASFEEYIIFIYSLELLLVSTTSKPSYMPIP